MTSFPVRHLLTIVSFCLNFDHHHHQYVTAFKSFNYYLFAQNTGGSWLLTHELHNAIYSTMWISNSVKYDGLFRKGDICNCSQNFNHDCSIFVLYQQVRTAQPSPPQNTTFSPARKTNSKQMLINCKMSTTPTSTYFKLINYCRALECT